MRPTIDYIRLKFNEFNRLCFEGKLKPVPFKLSRARSFLGAISHKRKRQHDGTWYYYDFVFKISNVFDLPEDVVEDTILHEMIHYYIVSNQMQDTSPHGQIFREKMNEINKKFKRNISVTHKITKPEQNSDERLQLHIICISYLDSGKCGITRTAKTRLFEMWQLMKKFPHSTGQKWVITTDPFFNKFPKSITPRIFIVNPDELQKHLKSARRLEKVGNKIITEQL